VHRPIPPPLPWQAITAFVGLFTLVSALADPVDLWRITVHSHQGQPFRATATLTALREEHIAQECLSLGPESDAPGSGMPFLIDADLRLNATGDAVEITTTKPISSPSLALVLRVQCPGAPFYSRHFTALIPPVPVGRPADVRRGFRLSVLPGDTVESIAEVVFPNQRGLQQALVREVVAGNPRAFPDGRSREVPAGTVLWFPDLRDLRRSERKPAPTTAAPRPARGAGIAAPDAMRPQASALPEAAAKPGTPIRLRKALDLGERPGPQECSRLMKLCAAEVPGLATLAPAFEEKARGFESGLQELRLKQGSIEDQLRRIEQSVQALQKSVAAAALQATAPPAPKPEIRTIVKTEPIPWYYWLGIAAIVVLGTAGGFLFGRKGSFTRTLVETDEQLDRMLATAANVMRELETAPRPAPQPARAAPPAPREAPPAPVITTPTPTEPAAPAPAPEPREPPDLPLDTQAMQPVTGVDVELESGPAQPYAGLSTDVLYEMDQALDNTRSMFTDVDRFIALGRTQNAVSLLQFQVHKDPKDRDSWIKLMAIYRQEKMDAELARAVREFKKNFPEENPPAV
jgi:hypothetical protein